MEQIEVSDKPTQQAVALCVGYAILLIPLSGLNQSCIFPRRVCVPLGSPYRFLTILFSDGRITLFPLCLYTFDCLRVATNLGGVCAFMFLYVSGQVVAECVALFWGLLLPRGGRL